VTVDLLVLVVPGIHRVPVDREVVPQPRHALERLGIGPHRILGDLFTGDDCEVRGVALERTVRGPLAWPEEVSGGDVESGPPENVRVIDPPQWSLPY
jgi:hypothetical protein